MEREIRYCTTEDGVRIAYCVEGEGPPLVICPHLVESFALENLVPERQTFLGELGMGRRVVRYDTRGTGLSQRQVGDVSLAALVRDLEAVVAAVGLRRFSIYASLTGGPRAIVCAAKNPRQVERLVLFGTFARVADIVSEPDLRLLAELARTNWHLGAETIANLLGRRQIPEPTPRMAELYRQSTSGDLLAALFLSNYDADVTEHLPRVRAKTIIVHYIKDEVVPFAVAQRMAVLMPNARLVALEDSSPHPAALVGVINAFLEQIDRREPAVARLTARPGFRALLFTDIVDHTGMMQRLGDERGRGVLREHERITREVLKQHGGAEVKTLGDGFMASFGSVTTTVECAIALQRAFEEWNTGVGAQGLAPLQVRIGLNAGEPIEEEGDLFGATVIMAARIAAQAEGGEILASVAVRELCAGKGFLFADRGESVLRGFEDPVRTFEVRWRE